MISTKTLADLILRRRRVVAALLLAVSALAARGYWIEGPPRRQMALREEDAERQLLDEVREQFEVQGTDCFLVVDADDLFTPQAVTAVRTIVEELRRLDYVDRVTSIDDVAVLNVFGLPEPLLPESSADAASFREARQRVLQHPLVRGQLLSPDGRTLLIPVTFDWLHVTSDADCSSVLLQVAQQAAAADGRAAVSLQLTGRVPLLLAQRAAFEANHRRYQILGYVLVFLLSTFLFRGMAAILIVGCAPALAIFLTGGLLNVLGVRSNDLTNVVLPVLITMVGLTDGVHVMVHIRRLRAAGATPASAVRSAIEHVGAACALTSLTTAIGFCSLMLARSEAIRDFGLACAIGVALTFGSVITVIPILCSGRLGRNIHRGHERDLVGRGMRRLDGTIDWIIDHCRSISVVAAVATVILAACALTLRPDARTSNALPRDSPAAVALAHCNQQFGGTDFVRVVIDWPADVPSDDPRLLDVVRDAEAVLAEEPLLRHPLSVRSLLAAFSGTDADLAERLPFVSLLPAELRDAFYRADTRRTLIAVRTQDLGIAAYQPVFARLENGLGEIQRRYPGFELRLTGVPVLIGRDLSQIVYDLAASLGTATLVILVVLGVAYRSLRIGLITIIPNIFPLALTGAMLAVTGQTLTLVSVCAFTVCIGIAVDDSIHFLTGFRQQYSVCGDPAQAVRQTVHNVGTALVNTTLILITGFGTVLASPLPTHRMFSAMACATISAALIGDLIFLPALLARFIRPTRRTVPDRVQETMA